MIQDKKRKASAVIPVLFHVYMFIKKDGGENSFEK